MLLVILDCVFPNFTQWLETLILYRTIYQYKHYNYFNYSIPLLYLKYEFILDKNGILFI
jgi:hypothetical protein